eukprot:TRINITY_DN5632_c0_g1_i1.p1 TRINITY_DN5632_c0_g1~~TRINITY_DN5632_c0_g1_i1.p1  ORF type:complete len:355 (-),score=82.88 TRINITY_DN5632_c0_g1_i1:110-1108(-)
MAEEQRSDHGPTAASAYAEALQDRLKKVKGEVEIQGAAALALRRDLEVAWETAETNKEELASLRAKWADEQQQREALLRETGEAERRLAERERRVAELLAAQSVAELEGAGGGSSSSSSAVPNSARGDSTSHHKNKSKGSVSTAQSPLEQQRQTLEGQRGKLASSLQELRDAVRHENTAIGQLTSKIDVIRKEIRALRSGTVAAKESEAKIGSKLEGLDTTSAAVLQRQQGLERQVGDLRDEVRNVRAEFDTALSTQTFCSSMVGAPAPSVKVSSVENAVDSDGAWALNHRLQAKVDDLRKDLLRKEEWLQDLGKRCVDENQPPVSSCTNNC